MKLKPALLSIIPLLILSACSNPADNVAPSSVTDAAEPTLTAGDASAADARYYAFGPDSSKIEFLGSKVTGSHDGGFRQFAGDFKVVNGRIADIGNKVVIATESLWSDNDRLTGHLKSADFFDVAKFPTATLESTAVNQAADGATVTGNLTLHGVTKSISFPAQIQVSEAGVEVQAEFWIDRFEFDMKYPGQADDLIRKEVVIRLKLSAALGRADFSTLERPTVAAK